MDANERAKEALKYIDSIEFNSFNEYIQKASEDGKLTEVKKALGELFTYCIICEKIGIPIDPQIADSLNN